MGKKLITLEPIGKQIAVNGNMSVSKVINIDSFEFQKMEFRGGKILKNNYVIQVVGINSIRDFEKVVELMQDMAGDKTLANVKLILQTYTNFEEIVGLLDDQADSEIAVCIKRFVECELIVEFLSYFNAEGTEKKALQVEG